MSSEKVKLGYNVYPKTKESINKLAELLDKNQGAVVDEIIADYTKDKVLSEDYYYHVNPYHFSGKDLIENGATKGYENKKPAETNNKDILTVTYIPTTFDEFNENFKTYCYKNEPYLHKGMITADIIQNDELDLLVMTTNLKEKEMNIELYNANELHLIEDLSQPEKRKEIEKRLETYYDYHFIIRKK